MTMQMNLVPLLPSFPFSGHANGAKWVKMGKKKLKMGKNSIKVHFHWNFLNFVAMLMGQNGWKQLKMGKISLKRVKNSSKLVKTAQNG